MNDSPTAFNDFYTTSEDTSLTIAPPGVLANDIDVDGTLSAVLQTQAVHGTVVLNANGTFVYVAESEFLRNGQFHLPGK